MDAGRQVVTIAPLADSFSAVCERCGAAFAGRLDPDLEVGVFLCRAGHAVRVERRAPDQSQSDSTRAA